MGLVNRLAEQADGWDDTAARRRAADAMMNAFERFGWAPSGLKADKCRKREKKRRDLVERLRK